jgi:allophanate hydrolase subunit 1
MLRLNAQPNLFTPGTSVAGSGAIFSSAFGGIFGLASPTPAGTWRMMGRTGYNAQNSSNSTTTYLRIS